MASGDSINGLATRFRLGTTTTSDIIQRTCNAIWSCLKDTEMPEPTRADWEAIEERFRRNWNFSNCVGALDGKHIAIVNPPNAASLYFNYKGHYSTVLLALVDAQYKFVYVDIGQYGSNSDGSVFSDSDFGKRFKGQTLDIPPPKPLPNYPEGGPLPHVIVADEAFGLRCDLMTPYSKAHRLHKLPRTEAIFNYRLSRARRIVENAFGILAQRFRIFNRRIHLSVDNVDRVVKAATVLHNYLSSDLPLHAIYNQLNPNHDPYLGDDAALIDLNPHGYHNSTVARQVRNIFKAYFNSPAGMVHWQDRAIQPELYR